MEEKKKVYIVTSGIFDDYRIEAVFSTENKAEEYVQQHGTDYNIAEWLIDEEDTSKKDKLWEITVDPSDKEVVSCVIASDFDVKYKDYIHFYNKFLFFYLQANSMNKAIFIAKERLDEVLYSKDNYYKNVFRMCYRKSCGILVEHYQYVNYFTGEVYNDL